MKILDRIDDNKIKATNILIQTTLGEYDKIAGEIIKQNPLQRNRVRTSGSIYSLLKSDLKEGIVIPPLVLGLSIVNDIEDKTDEEVIKIITENSHKLIILDGLQRTYTIRDLLVEVVSEKNDRDIEKVKSHPLRIEIYLGIEKIGILYRMLTLNTGQTPMSSRHQIEIIYSDYIGESINGIRLIRQVENDTPSIIGEYNFKDVIDGFTSYLERDYLSLERTDILDNIKSLEKLAKEKKGKDLFKQFVTQFDLFIKRITDLSKGWDFNENRIGKALGGLPFARNTVKMFNRSQVMTGFGSALGWLIDMKAINQIDDVAVLVARISTKDGTKDLDNLLLKLDELRAEAKKIGNDQRLFFHYFFRELLDPKSDTHLKLGESIDAAFRQYERKTK